MLTNKKKQVLGLLGVLAVPATLISIWLWVPKWQTSSIKFSSPDKQAEVENAYRTTLIQTLGGIFFFVTAYLSYRNLKATEEKQITERYSKSIEQLGDKQIEVRLGGIYALERIAKDSPKDHWTIMEVLTSFVQERFPLQENKNNQEEEPKTEEKKFQKNTKDVQAALTVIGRRDFSKDPEDKRLDLREANLIGADLSRANLIGADLSRANLSEASLSGANLSEASLSGADLSEANLWEANLSGADLSVANLIRANLIGANLIGANLIGANLSGADLSGANFWEASLSGADLRRAELRRAKKLTLEQVKSANHWEQAIYDPHFRKGLGLPPESTTEEEDN